MGSADVWQIGEHAIISAELEQVCHARDRVHDVDRNSMLTRCQLLHCTKICSKTGIDERALAESVTPIDSQLASHDAWDEENHAAGGRSSSCSTRRVAMVTTSSQLRKSRQAAGGHIYELRLSPPLLISTHSRTNDFESHVRSGPRLVANSPQLAIVFALHSRDLRVPALLPKQVVCRLLGRNACKLLS